MKITLQKVAAACIVGTTAWALIGGLISKGGTIMEFAREYSYLLPLLVFGLPLAIVLAYLKAKQWSESKKSMAEALLNLTEVMTKNLETTTSLFKIMENRQEKVEAIEQAFTQHLEQFGEFTKGVTEALKALSGSKPKDP